MEKRHITTFRLPPNLKDKLVNAGFRTLSDIDLDIGPVELAKEIGVAPKDAHTILSTIKRDLAEGFEVGAGGDNESEGGLSQQQHTAFSASQPPNNLIAKSKTALEIMAASVDQPPIITFAEDIDNLLGGGVQLGRITEFCGVPGIGKTQLGIQLAVDVHIPAELGGAEGHCIYIDTEGSFMPERVMEIGQSAVEHVQAMASDPEACTQEQQDAAQRFTIESIMERIFYFRVHDHVEQIALVIRLPELIAELKAKGIHIKLIVMDSITFHFRASHQFADMGQRTRLLSNMATQLMSIASENTLAVVLLNQVTTKPGSGVVPALGESWGHFATTRVLLERDPDSANRRATILKSPDSTNRSAPYQITPQGVRGVDNSEV